MYSGSGSGDGARKDASSGALSRHAETAGTMSEQTYEGSCHCGHNRFRVTFDLDHVRVCDCTLCRKRGALNHRVRQDQIELLTPLDDLRVYQWHTRTAIDYFCETCGILPFRRPRTAPDLWTINVRCRDGVDREAIPIERVHGSRLD